MPANIFKAVALGVAVAAPVGPMSLLCMRRTLRLGWVPGLATGAGIALADGTFAAVTGLGLVALTGFVADQARWLHLGAGGVLIWLGLSAILKPPAEDTAAPTAVGWPMALASSFLLTLSNPPTIISFTALMTAIAPPEGAGPLYALCLASSVMVGSLAWWILLVGVVTAARQAVSGRARRVIDWASGLLLAGFGAVELWRGLAAA